MAIESNSKSVNVWDYKPWWCQPWSILLTGFTIVSGSWLLIKTLWLTLGLFILIVVWWVYFLLLYPKMMQEYLIQSSDVDNYSHSK